MKAHIKPRWDMDGFDVFLYERDARGVWPYVMQEQFGVLTPRPAAEPHEAGTEPEPTMFLPREIIEAIAEVAEDDLRITRVASDSLADARVTRDRLLALVEKLTE